MRLNTVEKCLVFLFVFARVVSLSQFFPATVGGDSISYRIPPNTNPIDIPAIFQYFPETLFGNSLRPFFPVTFFYFSGSDNRIVLFQSIFAILCWTLFIYCLILLLKTFSISDSVRYASTFLAIVIVSNQQLIQFDRLIYSESLAFSSFAIYLSGLFLSIIRLKNSLNSRVIHQSGFILLCIGSILLFTTKTVFFMLIIVNLFILILDLKNFRTSRFILNSVLLFGTCLFVYSYNSQIYEYRNTEISYPLTSIAYYLSYDNVLVDQYLFNYKNDPDIPKCAQIDSPFMSGTQMQWGVKITKTCPEVIDWAQSYFPKSIFELFKSSPVKFVQNVSRMFVIGQKGESTLSVYSIFPSPLSNLVFASEIKNVGIWDQYETNWNRVPRNFSDPYFLYLILNFIMLFIIFKFNPNPKKIISSEKFPLLFSLTLLFIFIQLTWIIGILIIPGPAGEVFRLASIANVISRIVLIIIFSVIFDVVYKKIIKKDELKNNV